MVENISNNIKVFFTLSEQVIRKNYLFRSVIKSFAFIGAFLIIYTLVNKPISSITADNLILPGSVIIFTGWLIKISDDNPVTQKNITMETITFIIFIFIIASFSKLPGSNEEIILYQTYNQLFLQLFQILFIGFLYTMFYDVILFLFDMIREDRNE